MVSGMAGVVALVTGASRGIGRGIALEPAEAGADVYVTARSATGLAETVHQILELGGRGTAIPCDHADDSQVVAAFDAILADAGRLDLVVNVASPDFTAMVGQPFWQLPLHHITDCLLIGPRSNFVTTALAAPTMIAQGAGLVVNIGSHGSEDYLLSTPYGAGKAAIEKITHDTALELREHGVAVIGLWPGLVLTERMQAMVTLGPDGRPEIGGLPTTIGESSRFAGRAIIALHNDPNRMARTGRSYFVSHLARTYGFTDVDGTLPPEVRLLVDHLGDGNVPLFWQLVERFGRGFPD